MTTLRTVFFAALATVAPVFLMLGSAKAATPNAVAAPKTAITAAQAKTVDAVLAGSGNPATIVIDLPPLSADGTVDIVHDNLKAIPGAYFTAMLEELRTLRAVLHPVYCTKDALNPICHAAINSGRRDS